MKKKRLVPTVVPERDWPQGRPLQIDATRFRLDDGVARVYLVEDVKTRQCLAASAAATLSQERLSKDDERLTTTSENLLYATRSRLLLRRLAQK
ncbi:MAG TPA: hypothetical protein PKY50_18505 [Candidatus Competibacter sp.]|nr:hypothetical protein [Candidatus Competibacter sp.]